MICRKRWALEPQTGAQNRTHATNELAEDSRFARELIAQELGILALINRGVRVLTANGDDLTDCSDPSRVMMRQIAGAFHQYEKARLVAKLKVARDRKRAAGVKVEGRKSNVEIDAAQHGGQMLALARKLRRKSPKGGRPSLRTVAAELAKAGFISRSGRPYAPTAIGRMLGERSSRRMRARSGGLVSRRDHRTQCYVPAENA
jgi:hypothetical protein